MDDVTCEDFERAATHACGHIVPIDCPSDRQLAWIRATKCRDCARAAARASAAAWESEAGLPCLEGSPRQIAWAATIRADILRSAWAQTARDAAALAALREQSRAGWWIEHREGGWRWLGEQLIAPEIIPLPSADQMIHWEWDGEGERRCWIGGERLPARPGEPQDSGGALTIHCCDPIAMMIRLAEVGLARVDEGETRRITRIARDRDSGAIVIQIAAPN